MSGFITLLWGITVSMFMAGPPKETSLCDYQPHVVPDHKQEVLSQ